MPINNNWPKIGALVAALAVVLGGLEWHPLVVSNTGESSMDPVVAAQAAATISKAAYFQLMHGLAIILVGVLGVLRPSRMLWVTGLGFLIGIVLFSGSAYLSVVVDDSRLEYVKLAGVLTLVGSWIFFVEAGCPGWNKKQCPMPATPVAPPSDRPPAIARQRSPEGR